MRLKNVLFIIFIAFLFTGCELLDIFFDPGTEVNVPVGSKGDAFVVKMNVSEEIITASKTGTIKDVTTSRAAVDEAFNAQYPDTDSFIRALNNSFMNLTVNEDGSRAAGSSSTTGTDINQLNYQKGGKYPFWSFIETANNRNGGIFGQVDGICKYAGKHCYVFSDEKDKSNRLIRLTDEDYVALGQKFDSCYELETAVIGDPFYKKYYSSMFVPCNDKIVILVSDLFGDATEDQIYKGGTAGYFYFGDLFSEAYLNNNYNKGLSKDNQNYIYGNELEIFYVDSYFLYRNPGTIYSTLVHEFNHMINFVLKRLNYLTETHSNRAMSTWYTEMLAMVTEDMFQYKLKLSDADSPKARIPWFNNYYNYGFKFWDYDAGNDQTLYDTIMYANTYAFGAFLARNFGGVELIKEIAQNNYINEESITKALQKVNRNSAITFDDALEKFACCLFNIQEDGKLYTFNKQAGSRADVLYFSAIDLNNTIVQDSDGKKYNYPPKYYNYNEQTDLFPGGFSVHYIGRNIQDFTLVVKNNAENSNDKIHYFLITK